MSSSLNARIAAIARAFAMGPLEFESMVERGTRAAGAPGRQVRPLARKVATGFARTTRPRVRDIIALLNQDRPWLVRQLTVAPSVHAGPHSEWVNGTVAMAPVAAATSWTIPGITTSAALADWLDIAPAELSWFANCVSLGQQDCAAARHHYHYQLRQKPRGGVRLLEVPQARLKALQRRILTEILNHIPPFYSAAHGFVKGRSVHTFAAQHVGKAVLLRVDLADFFPQISGARVQALFRTLGYPESVADALGGICTNTAPVSVFGAHRWPLIHAADLRDAQRLYARPHLPQGAPTSPALANLCAYRLDCRLTGLADWAGAVYSRYADDLAFSGGADVARRIETYAAQIGAIAQDEGWRVRHHKTRIMRPGVQQRLTGLVVNSHVNCPRREIDTLRAILTNCVRHGVASQNRDARPDFHAHLHGRLAWVRSVNAAKATRLQLIFDRIDWSTRAVRA